ncbi:AEC family transporter [Streptococcus sp. 20-1249]|uniref:AEC family transporter n=1 Tax=Streptococcus hepaticus TaxID=3349163 RepID=UPI00374A85A7
MVTILLKAFGFMLVIGLGYYLKMVGIVEKKDVKIFSTIVMNVTLPCALLASASEVKLSGLLLIPLLLGFASNLIMDAVGYWEARKGSSVEKGSAIVQISGFNIGTFSLPFIQAFFPASYLSSVLLFDTGNALMVLGGNYTLAASLNHEKEPMTFKMIIKNLFSSLPFKVYLVTLLLAAVHISIPQGILTVTNIAGNANPFLAMLMLGMMVDVQVNKEEMHRLAKLSFTRLSMVVLMGILVYFLLPLPLEMRQMLTICIASPISVIAPVYVMQLGGDSSESANLNSLSILCSLLVMTFLIILFV